ncbi:MAG: hypothetical protein JSS64_05070 [Bacteroidetes bacterium]|nr:hypothetical protein [Bacteroidota bacterium]
MKRTLLFVSAIAVVGATTFLPSCKKDKQATDDGDTGYATDHARLEKTFDDVQNITDEAATTGTLANLRTTADYSILSACATVTRDTISVPHTVTVDFGTSNCLCADGRYRRGQIIVSYNGHYRDSASVHAITFNNFFVNNNQVTGSKSVTNMGHNNLGQTYFSIAINGSIILANNAGTISWISSRIRTWVAGESTLVRSDDAYDISGSATLTRANGVGVNINITSPLHVAVSCPWIEQGVVTFTPVAPAAFKSRTLDFGNGTCDALAVLTIGNKTYNVTLP